MGRSRSAAKLEKSLKIRNTEVCSIYTHCFPTKMFKDDLSIPPSSSTRKQNIISSAMMMKSSAMMKTLVMMKTLEMTSMITIMR